MDDEDGDVEPRREALHRTLVTLSRCLEDLDRLNAPHAAVRLAAACDAVRDELEGGGGQPPGEDR